MSNRGPPHRAPVRPDRIRSVERGFAFVPNRFLHCGFFTSLTSSERSLYFFLVLAGDRNGVSFYAYDRTCSILEITLDEYIAARNALIDQDLIAYDGTRSQVLSLPNAPVRTTRPPLSTGGDDLERNDPATIRQLVLTALDDS